MLTLDVKQSYCCFDYFNLSIKLFRSTKIFLISSRFIQSAAKLDFTILPIMYFHKADDVLIWVSRSSFYSGVAAFHNENLIVATFQHWTTISSLKCGHEISLDSSTFVPHHLLMILWKFSSTITCTYAKLCRNSTNKMDDDINFLFYLWKWCELYQCDLVEVWSWQGNQGAWHCIVTLSSQAVSATRAVHDTLINIIPVALGYFHLGREEEKNWVFLFLQQLSNFV